MLKRIVMLLLVLALAGAGAAAWLGWRQIHRPYRGFIAPVDVEIAPGTGAGEILLQLEDAGVLADHRLARIHLALEGNPPLQAGTYRFAEALTVPQAVRKLVTGDVLQTEATVREGLSLEETATVLATQGLGERDVLMRLMHDPSPIRDLDGEAETLEGYLFPESYRFPVGVDERTVVLKMVETFRARWEARVLPLLGPGAERSLRDVVILASIVEKEARLPEERPLISAVYDNRLRQGIALYADPTVIFALKRRGDWDGNIRKPDLGLEDPYNTYVNPGLPPGPICSPGLSSLEAAAAPAEVPYLYFVSRNDGSHVFSSTYREHRRNVQEWQRDYWRRERATPDTTGD